MWGIKGVVFVAYALAFGGFLLFSDSGVTTALGLTLITIASGAVVARFGLRRPSRPRE
ncbi:hypothetical protein [Halobellus marinus]|jgi:hypothetical protein|uniref:hypothetical protein n=1 Tax=Halobellus marinus TaxID=3075123 RepID=UPI0028AD56C7|nr:hypothetical protein [Halobellus sp. DFY28]